MTPDEARIAYEERRRINKYAWGMQQHYFELRKAHHYDSDEFRRLTELAVAAPSKYGYDRRDENQKEGEYALLARDPATVDMVVQHLRAADALIPSHDIRMMIDGYERNQAKRLELLATPASPPASASPAPDSP